MKVKDYYKEVTLNYISDFYVNRTFKYCYIKDCYQNDKDYLTAVKYHGWALQFVKNQTPEICLVAVQQNGHTLCYVDKQTSEICMAAVLRTPEALQYVINQTPKICMAAFKKGFSSFRNRSILDYIKNINLRLKIKRELNL